MIDTLRPEAALLVDCARVRVDEAGAERIRRHVHAGVEWTRVLDLARTHGMRPLLYHHLNAACADAVPPAILEQLRAFARLNAARNLARTRELVSLLSMLGSAGIRAVPYKGPALAETVYGSLALREFADLDILVRPEEAAAARTLMLARMYRPQYDLEAGHDAAFRREYCEYTFTHPSNGTIVEIQWDIAPRFFSLALDRGGLERRLGTATILGIETAALSPEDLLFILCVHGGKHAWSRLEWMCGVAEVVRLHARLDWTLVMALATDAGARRMLLLGLALARDLLNAVLPASIDRAVDADGAVARLALDIRNRLFDDERVPDSALTRAMVHMRMRERWGDRVRYGLRLSSTPSARDWMLLPSSPGLRFLAYPVRMTRLARKFASR